MFDTTSIGTALALLERGGPVMAALLFLSVVAVAIVLVKLYQFSASGMRRTDFIEPALAMARDGAYDKAEQFLVHTHSPVARVMEATVRTLADRTMTPADREAEITRVGSAELRNLESFLRSLDLIANLSPLLGLLGTVMGMIKAFARLEEAGTKVDPGLLAGGIWEALLTTAVGLIIAIPALAAFHLLQSEVDKVRSTMTDLTTRMITRHGRGNGTDRAGYGSTFAGLRR